MGQYWTTLISDSVFSNNGHGGGCKKKKKNYPKILTCWEGYVRRNIPLLFIQEKAENYREDRINDNFSNSMLQDPGRPRIEAPILNFLKANIVRLHRMRAQST
jgi:hypothetical protein